MSSREQSSAAINTVPTPLRSWTTTIENITSSNHFDLNGLSDARGFLMYTTSGLGLLPKVVLALASSTSESREEVLFDMLHSALTWSKDLAPQHHRVHHVHRLIFGPLTQHLKVLLPRMRRRKMTRGTMIVMNDDENDDVDTKRCTNITNSIEDSNQKSSHQHYQRDPNLAHLSLRFNALC